MKKKNTGNKYIYIDSGEMVGVKEFQRNFCGQSEEKHNLMGHSEILGEKGKQGVKNEHFVKKI